MQTQNWSVQKTAELKVVGGRKEFLQAFCKSLLLYFKRPNCFINDNFLWFAVFRNYVVCTAFLLRYNDCGSSSVDRALAFQAKGRGFESRLPLIS